YAASITYGPNGLIDTITHPAGTRTVSQKWVADPSGMPRPCAIYAYGYLASLTADATAPCGMRVSGTYSWTSGQYSYDGSGNVKQIGGNNYTYDPFGRLTAWSGSFGSGSRTYDAWGNVTNAGLTVNGTTNRFTTYGYDAAGNVTADGSRTFTYDALNMMTGATVGGRMWRYLYTPNDERIAAVERILISGVTRNRTTWTLRGMSQQLLRIYDDDETSGVRSVSWHEDEIYRGSQLLALEDNSGRHFYTLDHLGSPRAIFDGGAALQGTQNFAPFGAGGTTGSGGLQFTGHERDKALLSYGAVDLPDYMHARFDDVNLGRFLSVDRIGGDAHSPQSWNGYTYGRNNPVRYTDPRGLQSCESDCGVSRSEMWDTMFFFENRRQHFRGIYTRVSGFANAFGSDNLGGVGRVESNDEDFAEGQLLGDIAATLTGGGELLAGGSGEVAGVLLDATGAGAVAGVPVNVAAAGVIAHGVTVTGVASAHAMSGIKRRKDGKLGEFKGTDAKSRENKQVRQAMKAAGHGGDRDKQGRIHQALQGMPRMSFQEIVEFIQAFFD
ncbi:MAG TPA: RHS repeat-associated core domain-containing protein, partial [Thermoanaerobaculia bacterium]|nr:RHS repeat-associated core domain-containing protein [Thermoanaerobaculia bacterium]